MAQERIVVHVDGTSDALIRVLASVQRRGVRVIGAYMGSAPPTAVLVDVEGTEKRLAFLVRRLATMPYVASVEWGQYSAQTAIDSTIVQFYAGNGTKSGSHGQW